MSQNPIPVARTVDDVRKIVAAWHADSLKVGLVPTMGALHAGHLTLVDLAAKHCDRTIVSIFVNPTQFAAHEDLGTYPRDEAGDLAKLSAHRVDLIYAPTADVMYPDGFSTQIEVSDLATGLCAASRPHFFGGVATVVCKLFLQTRADVAVFGEKDYQQLLVIRRMARDLDIAVEVIGAPLIREPDGLAMSSRNAYLSPADRKTAPELNRILVAAADAISAGQDVAQAVTEARTALTALGFGVDYLELRDGDTLTPLTDRGHGPARLLAAAVLGKTRLLDNIVVPRARG